MENKTDKRPAAFLDRDGTLVEEVNFLSKVDDLAVFSYSLEAIRRLKEAGYLIIVVTNQSGIGRGIFEEESMHELHREINRRLENMIDAFYFCPHLPCDGCECRKPSIGMIDSAMKDFEIDLQKSWMIGDKSIDIETGVNGGVKTGLVLTGYGAVHRTQLRDQPDVIAENLLLAVEEALK